MSTGVIILAAGRSKKMQSTGVRSLLPINSEYLINHQINAIKAGLNRPDIIVVTGYENERLCNYLQQQKIRCVVNEFYDETSALKSLMLGIKATTQDNIFVIHGDIFFEKSIFSIDKRTSYTIYNSSRTNDLGIVFEQKIIRFAYGVGNNWGKIVYLNKDGTKMIRSLKFSDKNDKLLDFEMYNALIESGLEILPVKNNTIEINSFKDLRCVS